MLAIAIVGPIRHHNMRRNNFGQSMMVRYGGYNRNANNFQGWKGTGQTQGIQNPSAQTPGQPNPAQEGQANQATTPAK